MAQSIPQGKGNKVAATQGKITAQNPANQSQEEGKLIGLFTVEDLNKLTARLTHQGFIRPRFVTTTFEMADRSLRGARMSQGHKNVIQMAFSLLADSIPPYRPKYEYIAQSHFPSDIEKMIENGDVDDAIECAEYEIGCIVNDVYSMLEDNKDGYYDENIEEYLEKFDEYVDVVKGAGLEFTQDGGEYSIACVYKLRNDAETKSHYVYIPGTL